MQAREEGERAAKRLKASSTAHDSALDKLIDDLMTPVPEGTPAPA